MVCLFHKLVVFMSQAMLRAYWIPLATFGAMEPLPYVDTIGVPHCGLT